MSNDFYDVVKMQDARIIKLESKLKIAVEALDFYCNLEKDLMGAIKIGRKAREALEKLNEQS